MGGTGGGGTAHWSEITRRVLLVEEELSLFGSNTMGATSGGGTVHSSEVTLRLLLVEQDLPTRKK